MLHGALSLDSCSIGVIVNSTNINFEICHLDVELSNVHLNYRGYLGWGLTKLDTQVGLGMHGKVEKTRMDQMMESPDNC